MTALESLQSAFDSHDSGRHAEAEQKLESFLADYGSSAEAKPYLEQVVGALALSQLQQKKFGDALPNIERYLKEFPQGSRAEELAFWLGLCHLKEGQPARAQEAFAAFLARHPASSRAPDARFSALLCLFAQEKFKDLAAAAEQEIPKLPPELASQAGILQLYAFQQTGQDGPALKLAMAFDPAAEGTAKVAAYHLLTLNLGNSLLEKGKYRQALLALQRVWPKARILARQQGRRQELQARLEKNQAAPRPDAFETEKLHTLLAQIEGDIAQLEKIPDYDAGLNLRIAQCFLRLERYPEARLVLQDMVARLPDSDLLAQAHHQMLACLARMERWEAAIEAADAFSRRFPQHKLLPPSLYFKGEAAMRAHDYPLAAATFLDLEKRFPDFQQAERAHFLAGYSTLMMDRNPEGIALLEEHLDRYPKGGLREQAVFWRAMGFHFGKRYAESREALAAYLKDYPRGRYADEADFRRAQALFNQKQFTEAYKEFDAFLKAHPESPLADEARNQLGDSYLALGEVDRGISSFQQVTPREGRMYDYAQFRIGAAYKALEDFPKMRDHYEAFTRQRPQSPRLTEALAQIAWVDRRNGDLEKARNLYWQAIREHGDDPEALGVEDMLQALARMYKAPDERRRVLAEFADLAQEAGAGKPTLAARCHWIRGALLAKEQPEEARRHLLRVAETEPRKLSPLLLADAGDALRDSGQAARAELLYTTLLSWHPRSLFKDRAYAGLGLAAAAEGKAKEALARFAQFEQETVQSPLLASVLRAKATLLLERGAHGEGIRELEKLVELPASKGLARVEALYQIGETYLKQDDPKKAIPYFQRIYVMYGRWPGPVAKSYWESGQAFEKLSMREEAVNTYREFINNTHLNGTPEYAKARQRLRDLGQPDTPALQQPPALQPS
jgi:TolA-binding protein